MKQMKRNDSADEDKWSSVY